MNYLLHIFDLLYVFSKYLFIGRKIYNNTYIMNYLLHTYTVQYFCFVFDYNVVFSTAMESIQATSDPVDIPTELP